MKRLFWLIPPALAVLAYFSPRLKPAIPALITVPRNLAPRVVVPLSGTGSMYPTFPKGAGSTDLARSRETVANIPMHIFQATASGLRRIFFYTSIQRGDIVDFSNSITSELTAEQYGRSSGLVKRVIGLPGETIEIRDGLVLINGNPLLEPYTALPRSTFGGVFLKDCSRYRIPEGHVFVMGDNRKSSGDSRHDLGVIPLSDIKLILPLEKQLGSYNLHWRNTSNDLDPSSKIKINMEAYIDALNNHRRSAGAQTLKLNSRLVSSARLRGETMIKFDDFSFSATRSGFNQEKALNSVGYWNPLWGETWQIGYYSADELLENQLEFPESRKFLLDSQFQDIGLAEVEGMLNGCPTQVVVQHFGGYIPPDYSREVIESWAGAEAALREIQPGWKNLENSGNFYSEHKAEIDRINEIIAIRIANIAPIVDRMKKNQWLTAAQQEYISRTDNSLGEEQGRLATRINQL